MGHDNNSKNVTRLKTKIKTRFVHKIILHIDMNSYFASVEQQANPFLCGKPIGITGKRSERSIVATASIEAKKLGVKTAMSTWQAKKICPSLILITGDPEKYSEITHRFNKLFFEFTPLVQEFSVDESFLDITEQAKDWFGAVYLAHSLRERLKEECGERITASIGIAPNKLLAKLSSECVKPNGITLTRKEDAITRLDSVQLTDLCGIGPRMGRRLNDLGIRNFKQLREFPREELVDARELVDHHHQQDVVGRLDDVLHAQEPEREGEHALRRARHGGQLLAVDDERDGALGRRHLVELGELPGPVEARRRGPRGAPDLFDRRHLTFPKPRSSFSSSISPIWMWRMVPPASMKNVEGTLASP